VCVKFVLLGGGEKAVKVIGQEQFGLFTNPVHKAPSKTWKVRMDAPHLLKDTSQFDAAPVDSRFTVPSGTAENPLNLAIFQLLQSRAERPLRAISGESLVSADCTWPLSSPRSACSSRALRGGLFVFHDRHGVIERIGRPVTLGAAVVVN